MRDIYIYNTATRKKEKFEPIEKGKVRYYHCGPTVYSYQHIGNYRAAYLSDLIARTMNYFGYDVNFVTNITDVGHLDGDNAGDADSGTDRMEKAIRNLPEKLQDKVDKTEKLSPQIAEFFADDFLKTCDALNFARPNERPRPTELIKEQIKMIQKLIEKGYAYVGEKGVYYDTGKFENYGKLSGQNLDEKNIGNRDEVIVDPEKRNPQDFILWVLITEDHHKDHELRWDSPWGEGFPGWHIECSVMSQKYLGDSIDIHSGGKEHIPVHHENEIAQSEAATGEKFVNYWVHLEHLMVDGKKMGKSIGNVYTVLPNDQFESIVSRGFDPLDLRMLYLQAHYKTAQNFTWENLQSASNARLSLNKKLQIYNIRMTRNLETVDDSTMENFKQEMQKKMVQVDLVGKYIEEFDTHLADDFNTPRSLEILWKMIDDEKIDDVDKVYLATYFDQVLGLDLQESITKVANHPKYLEILEVLKERKIARENKDYTKSDELRDKLKSEFDVNVQDGPDGQEWWI